MRNGETLLVRAFFISIINRWQWMEIKKKRREKNTSSFNIRRKKNDRQYGFVRQIDEFDNNKAQAE